MSYFTAAVTRHNDGWLSHDIAVDEFTCPSELLAAVEACAPGGQPLVLIECEDVWCAFVTGSSDEPRVFASDAAEVGRGAYAQVLADATEPGEQIDLSGQHQTVDAGPADLAENLTLDAGLDPSGAAQLNAKPVIAPTQWGGDPAALADLGVDAAELLRVVREFDGDPAAVVAEVCDVLGLADIADGMR